MDFPLIPLGPTKQLILEMAAFVYISKNLYPSNKGDLEKLPATIVAEIKLKRKKIFLVLSDRHPNMTNEEVVFYMNS